jgi:hypothetical protein
MVSFLYIQATKTNSTFSLFFSLQHIVKSAQADDDRVREERKTSNHE